MCHFLNLVQSDVTLDDLPRQALSAEMLQKHFETHHRIRVGPARVDVYSGLVQLRPRVHADVRLGEEEERGHALRLELVRCGPEDGSVSGLSCKCHRF